MEKVKDGGAKKQSSSNTFRSVSAARLFGNIKVQHAQQEPLAKLAKLS